MSRQVYTPILKWKTGEKIALYNLKQSEKECIIPLLEFTDYQEPPDVIQGLSNCFNNEVFVDTIYVDEGDRHYLTSLIQESNNNGYTMHPVLYFDDFPDLADKLSNTSERVVVRVPVPEELGGPDYSTIFSYLTDWQKDKDIFLDLVLDLNVIENKKQANLLYAELKSILNDYVITSNIWQRIIVAVTSFPEELSSIPAGGSVFFDRIDIKLFEKIYIGFKSIQGHLMFSDYGVTKFTDTEIDFSKLRHGILPKAKYTTANEYWVLKGARNHLTKTWIKDYKAIAMEIYQSPKYYGENFSYGDTEIKERAFGLNKKGPGNNTNWVAINANHHLAVVIQELSKIYGS
ncbi:MAG TPA: hypothetical protein DEF34_10320 [Desulfotomaculum sp.]|nr:MAG: hypothetical protein JL56_05735 [Desulfotomaculum sp. BICA1-6]HBX24009.1 hypothetical protein [Desulfotomaculum sp.]